MRLTKLLSILILSLAGFTAYGQSLREEIAANHDKAGGIYYAYTYDDPVHTPAPQGYEPFYISHYGRHGSRWLVFDSEYTDVMQVFEDALAADALTARGRDVYGRVRQVYEDGIYRAGALTPLGTQQHRQIAERMHDRFPGIFRDGSVVNAESTVIVRCVISMAAFCERLKELNPLLQVSREANLRTTRYLQFFYGPADSPDPLNKISPDYLEFSSHGQWLDDARSMLAEGADIPRIMSLLFSDASFAAGVDAFKLAHGLFFFAASIQNVEPEVSFADIFTDEDLYWFAVYENYKYYVTRGPSPLNGGYPLYYAKPLLEQIIKRADLAVAGQGPDADLRFGHDINLMPLISLMRFEGYAGIESDPQVITETWPVYKLSPMAANLQMVFYRAPGSDRVLVRFLLNEDEMRIALASDTAPYYAWDDVREFYRRVMDAVLEPVQQTDSVK